MLVSCCFLRLLMLMLVERMAIDQTSNEVTHLRELAVRIQCDKVRMELAINRLAASWFYYQYPSNGWVYEPCPDDFQVLRCNLVHGFECCRPEEAILYQAYEQGFFGDDLTKSCSPGWEVSDYGYLYDPYERFHGIEASQWDSRPTDQQLKEKAGFLLSGIMGSYSPFPEGLYVNPESLGDSDSQPSSGSVGPVFSP